jgi:serine/threonine protein kinase
MTKQISSTQLTTASSSTVDVDVTDSSFSKKQEDDIKSAQAEAQRITDLRFDGLSSSFGLNTYEVKALPRFSKHELQLGKRLGKGTFSNVDEIRSFSILPRSSSKRSGFFSTQSTSTSAFSAISLTLHKSSSTHLPPRVKEESNEETSSELTLQPATATTVTTAAAATAEAADASPVTVPPASSTKPPSTASTKPPSTAAEEEVSLPPPPASVLPPIISSLSPLPAALKRIPNPLKLKKNKNNHLKRQDTIAHDDVESRAFIVQHCTRNSGDARYAIKQVRKEALTRSNSNIVSALCDLAIETAYLSKLEHPNIIKVRAVANVDNPFSDEYFLVLDRLYDTLQKRIDTKWIQQEKKLYSFVGKMNDRKGLKRLEFFEQRLERAFDLGSAIQYLHEKNIIHRDIKVSPVSFSGRMKHEAQRSSTQSLHTVLSNNTL